MVRTLVDIGTGLAALSQLGIQGSAAGTSLKNFYKELASGADKLQGHPSSSEDGVPAKDLKDANGDFLDMVTVVGKLSGWPGQAGSRIKPEAGTGATSRTSGV
jgi:hypothetical protein